jgi:hypothetical protein
MGALDKRPRRDSSTYPGGFGAGEQAPDLAAAFGNVTIG